MLNARRGFTIAELLVTMAVAAVVLAMFASVGLRERRVFADLADRDALDEHLGEAAAILPIDLRALSAIDGDIRDARDTSLEIRQAIVSAVVCDTAGGALILAPATSGAGVLASVLTQPDAGDSVWIYSPFDSIDAWPSYRVVSTSIIAGAQCAESGPQLDSVAAKTPRTRISLGTSLPPNALGAPLRITRPMRYSLYRASDGAWYLGARDWNATLARFNTIQPVGGPFLSASQGGLALRYEDSTGAILSAPITNLKDISIIQVIVRGQTRTTIRPRADSILGIIALRNRP